MNRPLLRAILLGSAVGVLGVLLFGLVHAWLIVPIWPRLIGGLPFGLAAGAALGWAFGEGLARRRLAARPRDGLLFGGLLWLLLVPMTGLGVLLRETGLRPALGSWEAVLESAVAVAAGGIAGWFFTRSRRAALALGTAALSLALTQGGPLAVSHNRLAAELFAGLAVIYGLCGLALALALSFRETCRTRPAPTIPQHAIHK